MGILLQSKNISQVEKDIYFRMNGGLVVVSALNEDMAQKGLLVLDV